MTSPDGATPSPAIGAGAVPGLQNVDPIANAQGKNLDLWGGLEGVRGNLFLNLLGGFLNVPNVVQAGVESIIMALIGGGSLGDLSSWSAAQQAIINDHTQQIEDLVAAFDQLILQGNAIVFTSNNTYYPTQGIVSVDLIMIGAGGGGGGGSWNVIGNSRKAGAGGGGGGEVHTNVPASLLPKTGGVFDPISIYVGAGGTPGSNQGTAGGGGGNTSFGNYLTAGGGNGGASVLGGADGPIGGGLGGAGMIVGGTGGGAGGTSGGKNGGNSTSAYDLHGGGGGGGGGMHGASVGVTVGSGGIGGISPGGVPIPGQYHGTPPSTIVATGGGGGAGAQNADQDGGDGAVPAGGGGGGFGGGTTSCDGGSGGQGILFVIERMV